MRESDNLFALRSFLQCSMASSSRTCQSLLPSLLRLRSSLHSKTAFQRLSAHPDEQDDKNPFAFLSSLPPFLAARIIDETLQSLIPFHPRSLSYPSFAALLSTLLPDPQIESPSISLSSLNFPLSLAVLQTGLRSGFSPPPITRRSFSLFWAHLRRREPPPSAVQIISSVRMIGYKPDLTTLNYLLFSLRHTSEDVSEVMAFFQGMKVAGCAPNSESYGHVIEAYCAAAEVQKAAALLREMVAEEGIAPRKGTVVKVVAALGRDGQPKKAADLVLLLEREGVEAGFEVYEGVLEGCLEREEFVVAGKMAARMAALGFIPYLRVRQRIVEGLAGIGQPELAAAVRLSFSKIGS